MDYKCSYLRENYTSRVVRWLALISILGNILFTLLYTQFIHSRDLAEVSRSFNDLFTPAGYVFGIWGLIHFSFAVYGVIQLLPAERNVVVYDRLSRPLIYVNVLSSSWIIAYLNQEIILSLVIIALTHVLSIILFVRSCEVVQQEVFSRWLSVPFSLFCGWISVANIANASVTLTSLGWEIPGGRETLAIAMVIAAGVTAAIVDLKFEDFIFPLVIVWSVVGIWIERQDDYPALASTALLTSVALMVCVIGLAVARYFRSERI